MGQGLMIKDKKIVSVTPSGIVGFGFLLPTNRVAYMGLAVYPDSIENNAVWSGLIETFASQCRSCVFSCEKCIDAHQFSCELLQEAEKLGILGDVSDQSDYWTTRNTQSLVDLSNRLRCGCEV